MATDKYMLVLRRHSKSEEKNVYRLLGAFPTKKKADENALRYKGRYGDLLFVCDLVNAASVEEKALSTFAVDKVGTVLGPAEEVYFDGAAVGIVYFWENCTLEGTMMRVAVDKEISRRQLVKTCYECCKYAKSFMTLREKRMVSKRMSIISDWLNGVTSEDPLRIIMPAFRAEARAIFGAASIAYCLGSYVSFNAVSSVEACVEAIGSRSGTKTKDALHEILEIIRKNIPVQDLIISSHA